jgi:hypothetical protein
VDKIQLAQDRDHWSEFVKMPLGFNASWVITSLLASLAVMWFMGIVTLVLR